MFKQPENLSYLSHVGFKFGINKLPNTNYFCQGVTLPGITVAGVPVQTPFVSIPFPGDRIEFQELIIRFIVDEYMENYKEIFSWMEGIGFPEDFKQYENVKKTDPKNSGPMSGIMSDATLIILTGSQTPKIEFKFKDAFPTQLASLQFDAGTEDVQYLMADATFSYRSFEINDIKK